MTQRNTACAGCSFQRKKCSQECVLAPHFPSNEPHKFAIVHRVFGTSYVLKTLQRAEAVKSMEFETTTRLKDPVHGCASAVHELQRQIAELESQLATMQEELVSMRLKKEKLVSLLVTGSDDVGSRYVSMYPNSSTSQQNEYVIWEDTDASQLWEPLWEF